ncbi:hypothetical protein NUACC26_042090 [Scytonema sp. NUACC26]
MFYAMVFLKIVAASKPANSFHDQNMDTPRLRDFYVQVGAGKVSLTSYEGQLLFGKVLLNEILHNMKTPRFAASIAKMF